MDDVQANGEPKKIFLSKPIENPVLVTEPTTSGPQNNSLRNCSGDQVRIPPRRHMPPVDKYGEEHLTNHKKQRYWNSWEELYLVELWRRYKDELTLINVPLPVYRKMMIAMRSRNMIVTAQDCRRKINTINTRYKQELSRMQHTGCKSEWRLFPLVHCVLQPKIKEFDPWHEIATIKKLLDKVPKPIEVPTPVLKNIQNSNNCVNPQAQNTPSKPTTTNSYKPRNSYQTSVLTANLAPTAITDVSSTPRIPPSLHVTSEKRSILPFRNINMEQIQQIRQDNSRLAEQRDADLKSLHMEEHNFKCFEEFIRCWTVQKELELQRIQQISMQNIRTKNNENLNVEQQLQESIIAK